MQIHDYLDFRTFVRDWLVAHPRTSLRALARRIGVSASLVSRILQGDRELDAARVSAWTAALRLEDQAARYFADLVELEAGSLARRQAAWGRISAARRFSAAARITQDAVALFSRPELGAIWQLARCEGFSPDPAWIASALVPPSTPDSVSTALDALESLGLLVRADDGSLTAVPEDRITLPTVPKGLLGDAVRGWHRWHLAHLADAVERVPGSERHIAGITMAVGPGDLARLKSRIAEIERELGGMAAEPGKPDRVIHVTIGLAPVAVSRST